MCRKLTCLAGAWLVLGALVQPALAHPGHGGHTLADGLAHPLGWDHLLAMIAVGLLAVRMGGRWLALLPAVFVGSMLAGGLLATAGVSLPLVEPAIAASVLVLGLLVAASWRLTPAAALGLVAAFAMFHGYAHILEGAWSNYAAGFVLATAALHTVGVLGGLALVHLAERSALRWLGGAISVVGASLLALVTVL